LFSLDGEQRACDSTAQAHILPLIPNKPTNIDEYLARVSNPQRTALEKLHRDILAVAPSAEEYISYGIPSYRVGSKLLVSFGAAKKHCAFYPGAHPIRVHADELKGYDLAKGTIRFSADKPMPSALVKKLVKTRLAERSA
jgi:uncharacterized protein YdhG (YjbR/CyaY superfamily)